MASYGAHHRTAEFRALFTRVLADVKEFIGTKNDVLVLTSSGTGFMEASVSNLTSPGDRVLVLTAGKFGERWVALAKAFGCEVETVTAPYGETFSLDEGAPQADARDPLRLCAGDGKFHGRAA
jgi:aspartate aminotransferase-like enzyme